MLRWVILLAGATLLLTAAVQAQDSRETAARRPGAPVPWDSIDDRERLMVEQLLQSKDWPFRAFGLLRLERYQGETLPAFITSLVRDDAWQVRCFALRQADRLGITVDPALLNDETEARVVRAALRHGVTLPNEKVEQGAERLLRSNDLDQFLLGLEIAAVSDVESIRKEAERRCARLIQASMDQTVAKLASRRMAVLLGLDPAPATAREWNAWLKSNGNRVTLPAPEQTRRRLNRGEANLVATMDFAALARLRDYLEALRRRELDLAIVMDTTSSMIPMITEARAGVDELIVFLRDISRLMRLAFVAYRDHDNLPVWEGQVFTQDIEAIREFLFGLRITGGADLPEAVLDGLTACGQLDWNPNAAREIVLVGDAPPHEHDYYKLEGLLENFRNNGLVVHTVHVPMEIEVGRLVNYPGGPDAAREYYARYNTGTAETFGEIARIGGGKKTSLTDAEQLVPSIMRFTIEEPWWTVFDEFYTFYLALCR